MRHAFSQPCGATVSRSRRAVCVTMPATIFGYIAQVSGRHQVWLALLSVVVFLLTMGPLELQRRIVNRTLESGAIDDVALLCALYAAFAISSGGIKLTLNIY